MKRSEKEKEKFSVIKCPICNSSKFELVIRNVVSFEFICECGYTFDESHSNVSLI